MQVTAPLCLRALALASLAAATSGQVAPTAGTSLPYFDIRLDADGKPTEVVRQAIALSRDELQREARAAAANALERSIPGARVGDHEFFDTPYFIASTRRMLTQAFPGIDVRTAARQFVEDHRDLFEIDSSEVDLARVRRQFSTRHNGVEHIVLQQQIGGIDLFGAMLKANLTREGELINIASEFLPRPHGDFDVAAPVLGPLDALRIAAADIGAEWTVDPESVSGPSGANLVQVWGTTPDFRADEPITTELIYFARTRLDVVPAWSLVLPEIGIGNTYEMLVDATDGTVLRRWNRLHFSHALSSNEPITLRVYTSDSPSPFSPGHDSPSTVQPPTVPRDLVTVLPGDVAGPSPDHWIDDGNNETFGNNVDAHTDLNADNIADVPRPQGIPYRVFDFPVNLAQAPSQYQDASVTNLFYQCNVFHDLLYELGWDEAASNFQDDNFGLGGVGGDRLAADAQDGAGTNNANFSGSGDDGSSGRIQMFVFDGPTPDRDGDFDQEIIFHEYAHGLSIRLSNGTVFGEQSGGMGEGWGDFFGQAMNGEPGDNLDGTYASGGYPLLNFFGTNENYYFGIRRFPYSTDLSKSPLTFADIDPAQFAFTPGIPGNALFLGNPADEVHNSGEIWCQALLEARRNMILSLGFDGNTDIMRLVVDGLKLQPNNPNMLDARDAILQADLVNNGGSNLRDLWDGFAKRGMGSLATSPDGGSSTTGVVEDFTSPPLIFFDYPNGKPTQLLPGVDTTFTVEVSGIAPETPVSGTGLLHVQTNGAGFSTLPMIETSPNVYEATLTGSSCFEIVDYFVSVNTSVGTVDDPPGGASYKAIVFTNTDIVIADDLEVDQGWIVGGIGDNATTGIWERVDPVGSAAQPEDDVTEDPGSMCFVTGQGLVGGGLGDNDVDDGQTTLISPLIDLSGGDADISYWRWYSNDTSASPNADVFEIDISADGGFSWSEVETIGPVGQGTSGGWVFHQFTVSDIVAPTGNMRMRFIASDKGDPSLVEAAIDEFRVQRLQCGICQEDLGFGGPGNSQLSVCGDVLTPGAATDVRITNAPANAAAIGFFGGSNFPVPVLGGTLVTVPWFGLVPFSTDNAGELFVPDGVVHTSFGAFDLYVQFLIQDVSQPAGWQFTNAVKIAFLP